MLDKVPNAKKKAAQAKCQHLDLPITLITDLDDPPQVEILIPAEWPSRPGYPVKPAFIPRLPYHRTRYLDTDTVILRTDAANPLKLITQRRWQVAAGILLAEDNPTNQKFAVRVIKKAGHSVVVANNGREAIEALKATAYDLVLMDVHMPEMDGYDATNAIRDGETQNGGDARTPIIAMTANAMKGDREKCHAVGMDGYVSKPVKSKTLFAEIDRVLQSL